MRASTDHDSGMAPSSGGPLRGGVPVVRRVGGAWWIAAGLLTLFVLGAVLFVGQAVGHQRVEADLEIATAAFEAARGADVRELATNEWQRATARMDDAMAGLHRQDGRFVLIRSYPRVHELLTKVIDAAQEAKATADSARLTDEGQHQPQSTIEGAASPSEWRAGVAPDSARAARDAARACFDGALALLARIDRCPRALQSKPVRRDFEVIRGNLEAYRAQFAGIQDRLARGDFAGAKAQADTLQDLLDPLFNELRDITTKFTCN